MEVLSKTDRQLVRALLASVAERPADLKAAMRLAEQLAMAVDVAKIDGPRREFWTTKAAQARARCEAMLERPRLVAERGRVK